MYKNKDIYIYIYIYDIFPYLIAYTVHERGSIIKLVTYLGRSSYTEQSL